MKTYLIKLDIDGKDANPVDVGNEIGFKLKKLSDVLDVTVEKISVYETKNGYHVYIEISTDIELDGKDVTFIQLFLGSDCYRELYNYVRCKIPNYSGKSFNVLFKHRIKGEDYGVEEITVNSIEMLRAIYQVID